jgi:hypothetical protein
MNRKPGAQDDGYITAGTGNRRQNKKTHRNSMGL